MVELDRHWGFRSGQPQTLIWQFREILIQVQLVRLHRLYPYSETYGAFYGSPSWVILASKSQVALYLNSLNELRVVPVPASVRVSLCHPGILGCCRASSAERPFKDHTTINHRV